MIDDYKKLGGKYLTSSKVLEINADKRITVINQIKVFMILKLVQ